MSTTATKWLCERCGREGVVLYEKGASVYTVINALEDGHREIAPNCGWSVNAVRVEEIAVKDIRAQSARSAK